MPTPPGYADISVRLTHASNPRPAYITFGVNPVDTDPIIVANKVSLALMGAAAFTGKLDSNVSITGVRASLGTDGGEDLVGENTGIGPGTMSIVSLPGNCAVLIHKMTTRGGRRGRGRMFVPWCVDEGNVDEPGIISAGAVSGIQLAWDTVLASLVTQTVPMVLLHGPGNTTPGPPDPVTSLRVDPLISTQRRRLGR